MKKFLTLSLVSTVVLSSLAPNLAYATEEQQTSEQAEVVNSTIQTETTSESVVNSAEVQERTKDSLLTEQEIVAGNQNLSTTDSSIVQELKKSRAVTASQSVTFPATIAEIFPDPNLADYMASSNGLDIPIDEEITQDVLANWLGNSLATTGTNQDHYFELIPMWGAVESLEGLQYLTNIQEINFALSGGSITTGDFTVLEQLPQLTKIRIDADSMTDASLATIASLPNLKDLSLYANITDLTPMNQPNVQIEKLDISNNPVSSLEPLQAMTKLKELISTGSELTDLTGIESLPLEIVNVNMNASLSDISAVANIKTLKKFSANWCDISDITPVESLTSLTLLEFGINKISTIDPVKNLVNLESLVLTFNQISDISPLQNLVNVKELSLENNNISDIQALKNLTQLTIVGLSQNKVSDISPLASSSNTHEQVSLDQNQILDFSTFQNSNGAVFGTDQVAHVKGNRTGEQIVLTNPARNTDGSILKPVTISNNGTYDEVTNQITWTNIPADTEVSYTFDQVIGDLSGWEMRLSGTVYVDGNEDDVPPVITADDKISYDVNSTVTADDFLKGINAATDDGSPIESNFDQVVDLTTPGSYEVTLTAKDAAGNEATPVKVTVTVTQAPDTTAPVITADDKISYEVNSTVTADDFLKGVHATTDDGSPIESDFDQVVDLTTPGSYEVTLTAKDAAGNEATPVKVTVTVTQAPDTTAPVITADDKISYDVNSTVTADDFLKGVHATTDDGSPIESNFGQVVDLTTPGSYEVTLTAKDAAGNEATPVKVTVTVTQAPDTTAPVITADDKISYEVNSTVTADDFLKGVHATTDDGSPIESDFDQVVDLTTPGSYEVTLTAKDAAGNEATPVKVTVTVTQAPDTTAPVITADDKISYDVNSTVTADDFLKGVHATTDDGSPIESNFGQVVDLTTPGSYEVTLTAKDAAGNEATPVKVTVTVTQAPDTTAPVITADDKISYEVNSTVTADDFLKGVHATTDDGSPIESDFDQVVDLTIPGSYEVTLTAKDAAGNEATPVKVTVIVSEPTKDPDDDQNIEDDKPVPPGDSEEPKDQPKDSSNDEPKNNTNDPSSNQKTEEPVKSTDTHSNGSVSATNHYHTSLPNTGETRSTMYTIFLGVFLLAGSFYSFFQKKKYLKK